MLAAAKPKVAGADTVMRMLERNARVATRYGGGFVERIDGLSGGGATDWFYYVNGVEATKGAAETKLHNGDHVWWDRHDWSATQTVPAIVGSFPEPFVDGYDGKRLPLRIECTADGAGAVQRDRGRLRRLPPARRRGLPPVLAVQRVIARRRRPYATLTTDPAAVQLAQGRGRRAASTRVSRIGGRRLALLDAPGRVVRTAGAGAGLIAATRYMGQPPVWYVTGTDAAGVAAAVQAFNAATLDEHFAVAVVADTAIPAAGYAAADATSDARARCTPHARASGPRTAARSRSRRSSSHTRSCSACSRSAVLAAGAAAGRRRSRARSLRLSLTMVLPIVASTRSSTATAYGAGAPRRRRPVRAARHHPRGDRYGAYVGLVLVVLVACCALASAAVDPDELLRSLRRVSLHSALRRRSRRGWCRCSR